MFNGKLVFGNNIAPLRGKLETSFKRIKDGKFFLYLVAASCSKPRTSKKLNNLDFIYLCVLDNVPIKFQKLYQTHYCQSAHQLILKSKIGRQGYLQDHHKVFEL